MCPHADFSEFLDPQLCVEWLNWVRRRGFAFHIWTCFAGVDEGVSRWTTCSIASEKRILASSFVGLSCVLCHEC